LVPLGAIWPRAVRFEALVGAARALLGGPPEPEDARHVGDMLVKAGGPTLARRVYAQARLSPDYARWPFRAVLEGRIEQADANVGPFRAGTGGTPMMGRSQYACVACHQAR
ncbi:MAG TPA: hypothetical protein PKC20_14735, partial [Burkholderiaceae bacterium]|nr:hypothetical protein [Burkholderiaceae bacterium]